MHIGSAFFNNVSYFQSLKGALPSTSQARFQNTPSSHQPEQEPICPSNRSFHAAPPGRSPWPPPRTDVPVPGSQAPALPPQHSGHQSLISRRHPARGRTALGFFSSVHLNLTEHRRSWMTEQQEMACPTEILYRLQKHLFLCRIFPGFSF